MNVHDIEVAVIDIDEVIRVRQALFEIKETTIRTVWGYRGEDIPRKRRLLLDIQTNGVVGKEHEEARDVPHVITGVDSIRKTNRLLLKEGGPLNKLIEALPKAEVKVPGFKLFGKRDPPHLVGFKTTTGHIFFTSRKKEEVTATERVGLKVFWEMYGEVVLRTPGLAFLGKVLPPAHCEEMTPEQLRAVNLVRIEYGEIVRAIKEEEEYTKECIKEEEVYQGLYGETQEGDIDGEGEKLREYVNSSRQQVRANDMLIRLANQKDRLVRITRNPKEIVQAVRKAESEDDEELERLSTREKEGEIFTHLDDRQLGSWDQVIKGDKEETVLKDDENDRLGRFNHSVSQISRLLAVERYFVWVTMKICSRNRTERYKAKLPSLSERQVLWALMQSGVAHCEIFKRQEHPIEIDPEYDNLEAIYRAIIRETKKAAIAIRRIKVTEGRAYTKREKRVLWYHRRGVRERDDEEFLHAQEVENLPQRLNHHGMIQFGLLERLYRTATDARIRLIEANHRITELNPHGNLNGFATGWEDFVCMAGKYLPRASAKIHQVFEEIRKELPILQEFCKEESAVRRRLEQLEQESRYIDERAKTRMDGVGSQCYELVKQVLGVQFIDSLPKELAEIEEVIGREKGILYALFPLAMLVLYNPFRLQEVERLFEHVGNIYQEERVRREVVGALDKMWERPMTLICEPGERPTKVDYRRVRRTPQQFEAAQEALKDGRAHVKDKIKEMMEEIGHDVTDHLRVIRVRGRKLDLDKRDKDFIKQEIPSLRIYTTKKEREDFVNRAEKKILATARRKGHYLR